MSPWTALYLSDAPVSKHMSMLAAEVRRDVAGEPIGGQAAHWVGGGGAVRLGASAVSNKPATSLGASFRTAATAAKIREKA